MTQASAKLLVAASGTGGHLFPAIATAEQLTDFQVEWLGVSNRLETQLVPQAYPLHMIQVEGFQSSRLGLNTVRSLIRTMQATLQVRKLLREGGFRGVLTTGGYISAPAILAAKTLGLPTILHESNALPGKVTRWLSPFCSVVAVGFDAAASCLPRAHCVQVGTPVRSQFRATVNAISESPTASTGLAEFNIPDEVPLIVVVGGSQGAVAVNQLVRQSAPAWLDTGAWIVHLTGENDPEAASFEHPHYIAKPFYDDMAALLQRANLAVSRAGAGTLTELAITQTPSILIPYPFAAEDHQSFNAAIFAAAGASQVYRQSQLSVDELKTQVLDLMQSPDRLQVMAKAADNLAIANSAEQLAELVRQTVNGYPKSGHH
ncbi:MAG: undecaprenyldiphospho-muramoylpentapeptide beta-N-acetylglucosaminyltransferase [Elainellaceae cyanobacterium]